MHTMYTDSTVPGPSSDLHQQNGGCGCIQLIFCVCGMHDHFVAREALRPVALLAGFARGTQICHGSGNRPWIVVQHHRYHLPGPGKLAAHEPRSARTDMACGAVHPRVGRIRVTRKFGFHDMAGGPAEPCRIHITNRAVGELAGDHQIRESQNTNQGCQTAEVVILPVERRETGFGFPNGAVAPAAVENSQRDQEQPPNEHRWQGQKHEDADIRVRRLSSHRKGQQEQPEHRSGGYHRHANQTDPVVRKVDQRPEPRRRKQGGPRLRITCQPRLRAC